MSTPEQIEKAKRRARLDSVDTFVNATIKKLRPKGTNALTTTVILAAVEAASDMARSNEDGTLDRAEAQAALSAAVRLMAERL